MLVPEFDVFAISSRMCASIAATEGVSKAQVFRFLEMQFSRADKNHDGRLELDEIEDFMQAIARPECDQR